MSSDRYSERELNVPGHESDGWSRTVASLRAFVSNRTNVDWQSARTFSTEALRMIALNESGKKATMDLIGRLEGARYLAGGDEHDILCVSDEPQRVFKLTRGDNFGVRAYFSPVDPEFLGHFHGETNADPFFYLHRWRLLNALSVFETRFEGILPPEKPFQLPRFCISQPYLSGRNPTPQEIRTAFAKYEIKEVSEGAFYDTETRILLTDAYPRNVRVVDGDPVPFDAIAQIASGKWLEWCEVRRHS